ncbi:hypothetical protein C8R47DRAFT_1148808 [Mycena vitilis]|nr:hypothetical protein C8R47DRAFT_1148808 [Mycena vitilis]
MRSPCSSIPRLMELPQEIIEAIIDVFAGGIDQDPWIIDKSPDILATLRACALVARSFVCRCQTHIFFAITLCGGDRYIPPYRLSTLLAKSPHLVSYIRAIEFGHNILVDESVATSVAHILSSVTNLERLVLFPVSDELRSGPVRDAFLCAFTLPRLRHLSLWNFYFADLYELEECLCGCPSLKSLMMYNLVFDEGMDLVQRAKERAARGPPRIVLDTLQLWQFKKELTQALLDAFTVIDITHLRWLSLYGTEINALLQANAATVQRLEILAVTDGEDGAVPANALANMHTLQTLELLVMSLPELNVLLRKLGRLRQLNTLRTVSVNISQETEPAGWQELDTLLNDAPALAEVNVYSGSEGHPYEPPLELMPALAARGVLRIRGIADLMGARHMTDLPPR